MEQLVPLGIEIVTPLERESISIMYTKEAVG